MRSVRFKYQIDPENETGRDTLCQTLRVLYRGARDRGDAAAMFQVEKCFDFAKRMDKRLKYYRKKYEPDRTGPEIPEGHPDE
jgi:hypothetical protein